MITHEQLMTLAIKKARDGVATGQSPFGCAIALGDSVVAVAHNTVLDTVDITAHAEINALREACRSTGNILLQGAVVATTCEPCPMCMAALHWARVELVLFGANIADATQAGFNELDLSAEKLVSYSKSPVTLQAEFMRTQCQQLFQEWLQTPNRQAY